MRVLVCLRVCIARENRERETERESAFLAIAEPYCSVAAERFFGSPSVLRSTVGLPFKGIGLMNQLSQIGWAHTHTL